MPVVARFTRWLAPTAFGLLAGCASWDRPIAFKPADSYAPEVVWTAASEHRVQNGVQPVVFQKEAIHTNEPFRLPAALPGADADPIAVSGLRDLSREEREAKIRKAYPVLPPLMPVATPAISTTGQRNSLADLQMTALQRNPVISRAAADAEASYGIMVQAGLYPNPHIGYQGDQIQPGPLPKNNAGQQGAFIQQLIKTCGKLTLARAAAGMDYANAQIALRRSQIDVLTQVRSHYFAVLVVRETMTVSRTLAELADEVYRLQLRQVATGETAGYEPLQLYAQAMQARNLYITAGNRYLAAWKQLAASVGAPDWSLEELAGSTDAPLPIFDPEQARQRILENHTDVLTAQNTILQAQYHLRLAKVTPIPDLTTSTILQHDNSVGNNQVSLQIGFTLPVFDRNQGNIRASWAQWSRALEDLKARRNDLSVRLADAMARYQSSRAIVENYRERILPNLSRAYRAIYQRYQQEPDKVAFNDIVVAQLSLGQGLSSYLTALGEQWTAVVDVANLLQIDDLYQP